MNTIQAVLFDCDGVIADSEPSWNEIDAEHLAFYGVPGYKGEHKTHIIGKSFGLAANFYKDMFGLSSSPEELIEQRTGVAAKFYADKIPTFDDVAEVLGALRERGLKVALATSAVGSLIRPFLDRHDITRYFDAIITGEQVKNGKPHPDIYLLAAKSVGIAPENCLVVEDALAGLQAGRSAGCQTVAIPDPRWLDPKEFEGKADFEIQKLRELIALVDRLKA